MNYRHAYHAGNFADVLKHMVLVALIDSLKQKASPFCYIDTHAGAGRYDLRGGEARRTGEADEGFNVLKTATGLPPLLWKYLDVVRACNEGDETLRFYPGSPWIAAHLMRPTDTAQLVDLRHDDSGALRQLFHKDSRIHVHERDGYEAMKAFVPPKEKRGLVLIDPPFEAQDAEFRIIEKSLKAAMERWPTGMFAVWYPIKLRSNVQPFHRWLTKCGAKRVLVAELLLHPDDSPLRLNGTGMAIINAPWKLDADLRESLRALPKLLGTPGEAEYRLTWLVEEGNDKEESPATQAFRTRREPTVLAPPAAPARPGRGSSARGGAGASSSRPLTGAPARPGGAVRSRSGDAPSGRSDKVAPARPGTAVGRPSGASQGRPAGSGPSRATTPGATRPARPGAASRGDKPVAPRSPRRK